MTSVICVMCEVIFSVTGELVARALDHSDWVCESLSSYMYVYIYIYMNNHVHVYTCTYIHVHLSVALLSVQALILLTLHCSQDVPEGMLVCLLQRTLK